MTEGLKLNLLGGGGLITAKPSIEMSASQAVLGLLTGPLKTFSDKVDAVLASQERRIKELEKMQPRSPMMLRTAQTEDRINELEKAVNRIMQHLGLTDDKEDVPVSGVQSPDANRPDDGAMERPAAELRDVRREDEPRLQQAAGNRGKRRR